MVSSPSSAGSGVSQFWRQASGVSEGPPGTPGTPRVFLASPVVRIVDQNSPARGFPTLHGLSLGCPPVNPDGEDDPLSRTEDRLSNLSLAVAESET